MSAQAGKKTSVLVHPDEVRKIADLARLKFNAEELETMAQSMSDVLSWMRTLDEVDTQGVEPLLNPLDQVQRLRVDAVTEKPQKDDLQALAAEAGEGCYQVPRVID